MYGREYLYALTTAVDDGTDFSVSLFGDSTVADSGLFAGQEYRIESLFNKCAISYWMRSVMTFNNYASGWSKVTQIPTNGVLF